MCTHLCDRSDAVGGELDLDLGTQYDLDDAFAQRMRAHQSCYRAAVLNVGAGVGPTTPSSTSYGNYLDATPRHGRTSASLEATSPPSIASDHPIRVPLEGHQ